MPGRQRGRRAQAREAAAREQARRDAEAEAKKQGKKPGTVALHAPGCDVDARPDGLLGAPPDLGAIEIPPCEIRAERVAWIAGLMAANKWPQYPHANAFRERIAAVWGVDGSTVRHAAAEAHRVVAISEAERPRLQAEVAQTMLGIARQALATPSLVNGLPDYESARRAMLDFAKYVGAAVDDEQRARVRIDVRQVSDAELVALGVDAMRVLNGRDET
jgi:hypothetical protein